MSRKPYASDLNDQQWELVAPLIPPEKEGGRPRTTDMREVVNAIFYLNRTGCRWDMLPHDFPAPSTVYKYFRLFLKKGVWPAIHDVLYPELRVKMGREPQPTAAIADSQSVKTTEKRGKFMVLMAARK
jgi:putative transposase